MPRLNIDYSNAVIYKLCCNDPEVNEIYIGSTTNMYNRKNAHKQACNNANDIEHNAYKYRYIRDNGGWINWSMIMIERVECESKQELLSRERYYIDQLKPMLNKNIPLRTARDWYADNKDRVITEKKQYHIDNKEYITVRHNQYVNNNKEFVNRKMICDCGYVIILCQRTKHYKTSRHKNYLINPLYKIQL